MTMFDPAKHPRGGNPSNPGKFSTAAKTAAEVTLAPTHASAAWDALEQRRAETEAALKKLRKTESALASEAILALVDTYAPGATKVQVVDSNWNDMETGGTIVRVNVAAAYPNGDPARLPQQFKEAANPYLWMLEEIGYSEHLDNHLEAIADDRWSLRR
ncbi:hypothetical protein ACFVAJ_19000 [Agromyces sp. NPDC057679]|uniref:hypothetical protein n=1 Tax=Agromyces sp. NPDC057679 TaxID=3346207 RepID=UPI00366C0846